MTVSEDKNTINPLPDNSRPDLSEQNYLRKGWLMLALISGGLLVLTWIFIHWDLDRRITTLFYSSETGWHLRYQQPWDLIYRYGTVPGLLMTLGALIAWFICMLKPRFRHLHRYFLVIVLTAILGPGLIVNSVLKNYWGRPRPRQAQEFGGLWDYRHITQPGIPGRGKSFPCGHATMGFMFVTLIYFRRQSPVLAYTGAASGLVFGAIIGLTRTVQGAHYPSDSIWSLGVILIVSVSLYYLILQVPKPRQYSRRKVKPHRRRLAVGLLAAVAIMVTVGFLMHRPFYTTYRFDLPLDPSTSRIIVNTSDNFAQVQIKYSQNGKPQMRVDAHGFAWTSARHRLDKSVRRQESELFVDFDINRKGYFAELSHELFLELPEKYRDRIDLKLIEARK